MNYYQKYLKYKSKYLKLKQYGGLIIGDFIIYNGQTVEVVQINGRKSVKINYFDKDTGVTIHTEDIPMLAQHFIDKYVKEFSKKPRRLGNSAARALMQYRWPGNVRELENVIERSIILGGVSPTLELEDLPESFASSRAEVLDEFSKDHLALNLQAATDLFTKRHIERVLTAVEHDKKQAAKVLGLGLSSLYRKIDDLNISSRAGEQAKQC